MNIKSTVCLSLLLWSSLLWAGPPGGRNAVSDLDTLPWKGRIVFGPWVRADDAPDP